jgi:hypothetical protein
LRLGLLLLPCFRNAAPPGGVEFGRMPLAQLLIQSRNRDHRRRFGRLLLLPALRPLLILRLLTGWLRLSVWLSGFGLRRLLIPGRCLLGFYCGLGFGERRIVGIDKLRPGILRFRLLLLLRTSGRLVRIGLRLLIARIGLNVATRGHVILCAGKLCGSARTAAARPRCALGVRKHPASLAR